MDLPQLSELVSLWRRPRDLRFGRETKAIVYLLYVVDPHYERLTIVVAQKHDTQALDRELMCNLPPVARRAAHNLIFFRVLSSLIRCVDRYLFGSRSCRGTWGWYI